MPPKRKASKKSTSSKKTKTEDAQHSKESVKQEKDPSDNLISLPELYKLCVPEEPEKSAYEDQLLFWEERGAVARIIWPFLVEQHSNSKDHHKDLQWFHGCYLLSLLVSLHCREGTFPASYALNFIQNEDDNVKKELNKAVLEDVLQTLVCHDQKGFCFQTTVVHFTIVVNTCIDGSISVCNPGLKLWHWMPPRRRELEFKKHPMLQKIFSSLGEKEERRPFLVALIYKIMHLLEGETDGNGKRLLHVYDPAEEGQTTMDEDDAEENDGANYGYAQREIDKDDNSGNAEGNRISKTASLEIWTFVHRSLELLIDLLSSHETRQFLVLYMDSIHFSVRCRLAIGNLFGKYEPLRLAQQQLGRVNRLTTLLPLESSIIASGNIITNLKSLSPSPVDLVSLYHRRASALQKMCYRYYPHLKDVIYAGVGLLCNSRHSGSSNEGNTKYVRRVLGGLKEGQLLELLRRLRLVDQTTSELLEEKDDEFLWNILLEYLTIPPHPQEQLKSFPLYPIETVLWDHHLIPPTHFALRRSSPVLSLPKFNKQFLSYQDYLLRNFELVRLESAYEIRSDLVDVLKRVRPLLRQSLDIEKQEDIVLKTEFSGWARMALELDEVVEIKKVEPPRLGETLPAQVIAEFAIDLKPCGDSIRREWDDLGEYDNLFLITVDAGKMTGQQAPLLREYYFEQHQKPFSEKDGDRRVPDEEDSTFPQRYGVTAVRGCMVLQVRDEQGTILNEAGVTSADVAKSTKRIFRVALDPSQYVADRNAPLGLEMYQMMNLVVRRKGSENNFKSVLETIRGLMDGVASINRVMPSWLQLILLGCGDPTSASYKSNVVKQYARSTVGVANPDAPLDFGDTFLDEDHLRESFAYECSEIKIIKDGCRSSDDRCNYRIRTIEEQDGDATSLQVIAYPFPPGVNGNPVRFTPPQVEAIRSGLSPGLTLVVGPPGTGKTDVAVQIIASLYHSFPTQRTVIITHSNAALNDIFQKVMSRGDVEERYLVRLGSGERDLRTSSAHDFTKTGRVAYSLDRRSKLLEQVQELSESLGISSKQERGKQGSAAYTCETADYFYMDQVNSRIRIFEKEVSEDESNGEDTMDVTSLFPFKVYFGVENGKKITLGQAKGLIADLKKLFSELEEYRPLELLHTQRQRSDYLIMKQARVVAMTCTHAAIARSHLIDIGFEYDNVVMEEAGQMLDIEAFIPLLLQRGESDESSRKSSGLSRLKRVCLMGDHNQLPPVVKNMSFSKFSNLDQSLFSRLIRLGVPYVQLDKQGRARSEIANLYRWRYKELGDQCRVQQLRDFQLANSGFAHTFQIINVDDFEGRGESTPTAYFYQNVGEAEYAAALFQYMVLIGHNPERISILTTYNGQRALINDIISQRCGDGTPLAGIRPGAISTVDKYQGQQNDFVLLSLVRTEHVGHLRDIRRLVVAVSRSRLGLYVFCRQKLFDQCHELKRTMEQFSRRPSKLQLVLESHPTQRMVNDEVPSDKLFEIDDVSHLGSVVHSMQEDLLASHAKAEAGPEPMQHGEH